MKVSESWLREWVNPPITGEQLAAQLTMAGLEVDARNPVAGDFDHVVVGEVVRTTPHPQADRLTLCEVKSKEDECYQVVCGARNVRAGLKVALALPGAQLPGGMIIKETKLRGELSQGMLCSSAELGLEDQSEGILELKNDAPLGVDLREYLALDDHVLDVDLTPNRADCFSILGIAREVAVLNKLPLRVLSLQPSEPQCDDLLQVDLQASEACPQYCGRVIRAINPHAETPLWIKERLRRSGLRPIHPVVDITNYVMLELGQPMHAFDLQKISGDIQVRYSRQGEALTVITGEEIHLDDKVLLVADDVKPLAIAGVMGGEDSAVSADTVDIFLESAYFNPLSLAGIGRRYGILTDSSQRFERGVDPALQVLALERASELLQEIVGGKLGPINLANLPQELPTQKKIGFSPARVLQLTGVNVPEEDMSYILKSLGMQVSRQSEKWQVIVPSYRFDLQLEVDLVEEIVRIYGYNNIAAQPMLCPMQAGSTNSNDQVVGLLAEFLSSRGYHETISYSFVDPELQQAIYPEQEALKILNPISQELSQMRIGIWPGLLASMIYNLHRSQTTIKFFEVGVVFNLCDKNLTERPSAAGLLTGLKGDLNWAEPTQYFDFYDLKGDLQALFAALKVREVSFVPGEHTALHPGQTAKIVVNGKEAGWLGALHPRLADALELEKEVILFELFLDGLMDNAPKRYYPISKYPRIRRDLSFLVDNHVTASEIEKVVRERVPSKLLKAFDVFDVYTGASISAGQKSLAIALTLQDDTRTLIDAQINEIIDAIIIKLKDEFAITLRD